MKVERRSKAFCGVRVIEEECDELVELWESAVVVATCEASSEDVSRQLRSGNISRRDTRVATSVGAMFEEKSLFFLSGSCEEAITGRGTTNIICSVDFFIDHSVEEERSDGA